MNYDEAKQIINAGNDKNNPLANFIDKKKLDQAIDQAQEVIDNAENISNANYQKGRTISTIEKRLLEAREELKNIEFGIAQLESYKDLTPDELRQLADLKELRADILDEVQTLEYAYANKNKSDEIKALVDERKSYKKQLEIYKQQLLDAQEKKSPQAIIDRINSDIVFCEGEISRLNNKIEDLGKSNLATYAYEDVVKASDTDSKDDKDIDKSDDQDAIAEEIGAFASGKAAVQVATDEDIEAVKDSALEPATDEEIEAVKNGETSIPKDMIEPDNKGKQKVTGIANKLHKFADKIKANKAKIIGGTVAAIALVGAIIMLGPVAIEALGLSPEIFAGYVAKKAGVLGK